MLIYQVHIIILRAFHYPKMTFTEFKQLIPSLSRLYADFLQVILETRLQLCIQQKLSNKIIFPTLCCNLCLAL